MIRRLAAAGVALAALTAPAALATPAQAGARSVAQRRSQSTDHFYLYASDGTRTAGTVDIVVDWTTPTIYTVRATRVQVVNHTGRSITVPDPSSDEWTDGVTAEGGKYGQVPNGYELSWYPTRTYGQDRSPYVWVGAYATTRPGMHGSGAAPAPQSTGAHFIANLIEQGQ